MNFCKRITWHEIKSLLYFWSLTIINTLIFNSFKYIVDKDYNAYPIIIIIIKDNNATARQISIDV